MKRRKSNKLVDLIEEEFGQQGNAHADFQTEEQTYPARVGGSSQAGTRYSHELAPYDAQAARSRS
jgi:hypothetical protein